ncbi:type II secretion system pilot lipoprotein GspS-beta [Vibrio sp. S9_S30]|nr:type II secretion system pilot lipoprotein GspS-beta [Vibrio sp. S9_S30]
MNQKRNTFVLSFSVLLSGCLSNQMSAIALSDYRATMISSQLPRKIGPLTLVKAQSDGQFVTLYFNKEGILDMDKLIKRVAIHFCNSLETRDLMNRGVSYRISTFDPTKTETQIHTISEEKCLN